MGDFIDIMITIEDRAEGERGPLFNIYGPSVDSGGQHYAQVHIWDQHMPAGENPLEKPAYIRYNITQINFYPSGIPFRAAQELASCLIAATQIISQLVEGKSPRVEAINFNYSSKRVEDHPHDHDHREHIH